MWGGQSSESVYVCEWGWGGWLSARLNMDKLHYFFHPSVQSSPFSAIMRHVNEVARVMIEKEKNAPSSLSLFLSLSLSLSQKNKKPTEWSRMDVGWGLDSCTWEKHPL